MALPPDYNVAGLVSAYSDLALPFVSIAFLFCVYAVIHRILKNI